MTCTHNCTHQPCPSPHGCGVGNLSPLPVIDETMIQNDKPMRHLKGIPQIASLRYASRSGHDDMTYSGPFNGAGIPLYQDNSDSSDPHEAPFSWVENFCRKAMRRTFYACCLLSGCGAGVAFFMYFYRMFGF